MLNKALVIAISYLGTTAELRGCVSDGERIYAYLKRSDPQCEIRVLCDDRRMKAPIFGAPTYAEIMRQIDWLVGGATSKSHLWISYSGHGGSQAVRERAIEAAANTFKPLEWIQGMFRGHREFPSDDDNTIIMQNSNSNAAQAAHACNTHPLDITSPAERTLMKVAKKGKAASLSAFAPKPEPAEIDGANETILPSDFGRQGEIVDDLLRRRLVDTLPAGAKLTAFFDSCHSGTVLDLRYNWLDADARSKYPSIQKTEFKSVTDTKAQVLMLSGCRDAQTSADAYLDNRYCGATTQAFLFCLSTLEKQANLVKNRDTSDFQEVDEAVSTRAFGDYSTTDNTLDTLDEFLHAMNKWMVDNKFAQRPQISLGRNENIKEAVATFFPIFRN